MSPVMSSTGMRLIVAVAAPVTMFVAPGPIDVRQANALRRFDILAKPMAVWTIDCSLRARWYGNAGPASWSPCATPPMLPWPKIPQHPAKNRCASPSSSTYWFIR